MGDPHDPKRYGETWTQHRIDAYLAEMEPLREHVVLSGGWAWHAMSPVGHVELKHAHDHKDLDLMVPKRAVATAMSLLLGAGFVRVPTRYDRLPSDEEFRRYEKHATRRGDTFRITIDFFVRDVPELRANGWRVVSPPTLLSFYSTFHGSRACFAVQAAHRLLQSGVAPRELVGRPELVAVPS